MAAAPRTSLLFSPVWPWMFVSLVVHGLLVALFGLWGVLGYGLTAGHGIETGDGFGGSSVEIEIIGDENGPPTGSVPGSLAAAPPAPAEVPEPETEPAPESEGTLPVEAPREARRPRNRSEDDGPGESETPAASGRAAIAEQGDPEAENATQSAPGEDSASGTGGEDSTAGTAAGDPRALILGSVGAGGDAIAAQRALLPNAGACSDPVVGTWRAQKYRASDRTWVRFILRVRRDGGELRGSIVSRIWRGRASNPMPGECTAFGYDHTWRMEARGRLDGERFTFGSRQVRLIRQDCPMADTRYAPDNFSGTLRAGREIYNAMNNDGAFDIDEPYTFRRTSCE